MTFYVGNKILLTETHCGYIINSLDMLRRFSLRFRLITYLSKIVLSSESMVICFSLIQVKAGYTFERFLYGGASYSSFELKNNINIRIWYF